MESELVIITPEITPGSGGVADHTLALLRSWGQLSNLTLLVPNAPRTSGEWNSQVKQLGATAISKQLPPSGGNVFVQYSAYGFSRVGYPRELLAALIDWKTKTAGRLVVMFHEIWAFWPIINKNFLIQQLHRRTLKRLLPLCDAVFTTTTSQAEHLRHLSNSVPIQVVPSGSNIRRQNRVNQQRKRGWVALFGLQSTRIRTLENMRKSLAALAGSGRVTKLICVGQGSDSGATERERELLGRIQLREGFSQQGGLAEAGISDLLGSVQFGLFGQHELSCTKSGSFMAYAAHQVNVIAEFAGPSKPPPICWLVAPAELLGGLPEGELDRRAECLRMWQEQNCSWDIIATKLGRSLGIETGVSTSA